MDLNALTPTWGLYIQAVMVLRGLSVFVKYSCTQRHIQTQNIWSLLFFFLLFQRTGVWRSVEKAMILLLAWCESCKKKEKQIKSWSQKESSAVMHLSLHILFLFHLSCLCLLSFPFYALSLFPKHKHSTVSRTHLVYVWDCVALTYIRICSGHQPLKTCPHPHIHTRTHTLTHLNILGLFSVAKLLSLAFNLWWLREFREFKNILYTVQVTCFKSFAGRAGPPISTSMSNPKHIQCN